ncbi:DUF6888 family protein [Phormidesmis priestleyi]|uniref:DUF6888 family protein n=1 Tax=Phormidesmis priestleyi TaxID=268141 RepID=UPI0039DF5BF1
MSPTIAQAFAAVQVCQLLSNLYRDIYLFRFNPITGIIYILAQENIEIVIQQNGIWDFL